MSLAPLVEAPECLVTDGKFQFGRFNAPPLRQNMLDVSRPYHYPVPAFLKRQRLKEWRAFQFGDPRWFFFTALYSSKVFNLVIFYAYDREAKKRYGFRRVLPGKPFPFGEELRNSKVSWTKPKAHFSMDCALEEGRIELDVSCMRREESESFGGHFSFAYGPSQTAPLSVCLPLGLNRAMYSTKVLMPMTGRFSLGAIDHAFEPASAMGVMDDHKGYYPYVMRYDWVSGFGTDAKGRRIGFNLTDNQVKEQERYNENCLWINNRIYSLPPVKVTRPAGPAGDWIIQDLEGMVDLVFIPQVPNDLSFNAGLFATDYHGPMGSFRGVIKNGTGEKIDAEILFGAGEQKYLRG